MPSWVYLRGDADAVSCNEPPDVVLRRVEQADADAFIHLEITPYAHDDAVRTGYVRARDVAAVLPMHPRDLEADLDDPPDWYSRGS
jgi:hypothetical protein